MLFVKWYVLHGGVSEVVFSALALSGLFSSFSDVLRFKQSFLFCFFVCEIAAQGKVYEHINKPWCLYAVLSFTYLLKRMGEINVKKEPKQMQLTTI